MEIEFLPIIPLHDQPNNNGGIGYLHHETPIFDQSKCYTIFWGKNRAKNDGDNLKFIATLPLHCIFGFSPRI